MVALNRLEKLARRYGTPLFVVDHAVLRRNYQQFRKYLPRVQAYYAVKANADPAIVKTFYEAGASFDVASWPEFRLVYQHVKHLPAKEKQHFIWDKIIYANPIKDSDTLLKLDRYKPLVTYDNFEEVKKVKKYAPHAGLVVEGLSFHVGSQCTNFANYVQALNLVKGIFQEAWDRGYEQVKILDIGGGFPAPYDENVQPFRKLAHTLNS